jgi:histidyl-tRNA synthetase
LRLAGIGILMATGLKSLKAQLRQANSRGARFTVIIGEQEVAAGTTILRDMATSEQEEVPAKQLEEKLRCQIV